MQLDNSTIVLNDTLYDIARGYGKAIVVSTTSVEIQFTDRRVTYTAGGMQRGKTNRTLFWDVPYIMAPKKNDSHWTAKKVKFDAILALIEN